VKEKTPTGKLSKNSNLKNTSTNLFLNIIIFLLSILIVFLAFSAVIKIENNLNTGYSIRHKETLPAIQVEVLNGCGISGVAQKITNYLRSKKFDVVQMGNYISFDVENTIVIDRTGNIQNAYDVAEALGVDKQDVIQQINKDYFLDVSVIVGKDYNKLIPNK